MNINESMKKAMSSLVQKIDNVSYDLQTGSTGIKTEGGIITLGKDNVLDQNPMDFFSIEIPAFAMLTPASQVRRGDILVSAKKAFAFIVDEKITDDDNDVPASVETMNLQGQISRYRPKRLSMMGINNGLTIVRSFGSMFGTNENNNNGFDMSSMLPLMMLSGDNKDMSSMLPLMMMSGGMKDMNPLMMMMLMGDKNPFA